MPIKLERIESFTCSDGLKCADREDAISHELRVQLEKGTALKKITKDQIVEFRSFIWECIKESTDFRQEDLRD